MVEIVREARYGLRGARVGEASNPGPLIFRWPRRARSAVIESETVVQPTSTMIDSEMPETHRLTDSDGTGNIASSGFLNVFTHDLEAASTASYTEQDITDDESDVESVASGRTGAWSVMVGL